MNDEMGAGQRRGSSSMGPCGCFSAVMVLLLLLSWLHPHLSSAAQEELVASFYGDSYIKFPIPDSRTETEIRLNFRTSRSDGLLLLAAGTFDYCLISMQSGILTIRLDLGSGDAVLSSPPGFIFNDLSWHSVWVNHRHGNVTLVIDEKHISRTITPGSFFELNIDKHLYAGGIPDAGRSMFLGSLPAFRGCLRGVTFNDISVLEMAKKDSILSSVHALTWNCSSEFSATSDQPIGFLGANSFIAFPIHDIPHNAGMTFAFRTNSQNALLVFSSGYHFDSDFLAIEIVSGKLRLTLGQGADLIIIPSEQRVNNGYWHNMKLTLDDTSISFAVNRSLPHRHEIKIAQAFHRNSLLYFGGVGAKARALALYRRLNFVKDDRSGSLTGCMSNVAIDNMTYGFSEAAVTKMLAAGCFFNGACVGSLCGQSKKCHEDHCTCTGEQCAASDMNEDTDDGLLRVRELVVSEGRRAELTVENIVVSDDYKIAGIQDSQVLFQVVKPPNHGKIFVNGDGRMSDRVEFSLLDLMKNHVTYVHDDSEVSEDSIGMQLEFVSLTSRSSEKFNKKYGFALVVKVLPNNDPPELILPVNNSLEIVSGAPVKITTKILNISDADDSSSNLEYAILSSGLGNFELVDGSGTRTKVTRFTYDDVVDGKVRYVSHKGATDNEIKLQVSDGKYQSDARSLKVFVIPLKLTLTSNTGLLIHNGSVQAITHFNLSTATNAVHQDIEVRYDITHFPSQGEIQRQQNSDNQWTSASAFTQKHIDRNRLCYVHRGDSQSSSDRFRFQVSALDIEMQEFEFRIQVIETKVRLLLCTGLRLKGTREGIIKSDALSAVSSVPYHSPSDITYHIIATPTKGHLFRLERRGTSGRTQKRRLSFASNFTQAEVNEGKIGYKFQKTLYSPMTDDFEFILLIPEAQSGVSLFALSYEPVEGSIRFINNGLIDVLEGGRKMITSEDLFTEKNGIRNFRYSITDGTHHGVLQLVDKASNTLLQDNITAFSNDDIKDGRVYYQHDDSETDEDTFGFTTTPIIDQPKHAVLEITELSGMFEIKIMLRNDNEPKREVEKVFGVVANRGRIVTPSDIWYTDPDVNYDSLRLEYELANVSNGEIVLAGNHSININRFTQKDIAEARLYFKHNGPHYSRSVMRVTDGYFTSTGILEFKASEPFIRVTNVSVITVEKGQSVDLQSKHFSIETNLDASNQSIRFVVVEAPTYGILKRNKEPRHGFNLADLNSKLVTYEHGGGSEMGDSFKFLAKIENFQSMGTMQIFVTSEAYRQHSLRVVNNKVSVVEELDALTLTRDLLYVMHPADNSACIKFSISSPPKHGRLSLSGKRETSEVNAFMQDDVTAGRVTYRHVDKGQLSDVFQFDVHCGTSVLAGLDFVIEVVPSTVPLVALNLTVGEGETTYIKDEILQIVSKFYLDERVEFVVATEPLNGRVVSLDMPELKASHFSMEHLKEHKIVYVHDDSETSSDKFTLFANSKGKRSDLKTVHVTVLPKNDEPPVVLINKRLDVWTGAVTPITQGNLYAEDGDTELEEIVYVIGQTVNGSLSLTDDGTTTSITNFSQADINHKRVIFTFQGNTDEGSFEFEVTDGVTWTETNTFHIESKSLLLFLEYSRRLEVFPGLIQSITLSHLKAVTNDSNHSHPIVYTVQTKPKHGRLITYSELGSEVEVSSFFQEELNANLISYHHSGRTEQWSQADSFTFEVRTAYAPSLEMQVFDISISYDNINEYNKNQLLTLGGTVVDEGGDVVISQAELDISKLKSKLVSSGLRNVEVNLVIHEVPRNGTLRIRGKDAAVGTRFVQDDITRDRVTYTHDNTESLWDTFSFTIELETRKRAEGLRNLSRSVNTFVITIRPLNDQPFVLHTQSPTIELIQGYAKNITRSALLAEDLDTPPGGIKYEIITPPNNGLVLNVKQPSQSLVSFTQRDIDENLIVFIHDGSTDSGAFYFRVSDGRHKPLYKVFNICVIPLKLDLPGPSVLELLQGQFTAWLYSKNFNVETNGRKENVVYNLTHSPQHGLVYLHNSVTERFTQVDVEDGKVAYIQTDINHYNDSIEFTVTDGLNVVRNRRLEIIVRPNLKRSQQPFRVVADRLAVITTAALDAGDLARASGSDPSYYVTVAPQHGQLIKTIQKHRRDGVRRKSKNKESKRKPDETEFNYIDNAIVVFTHSDIVNERVSYHPSFSDGVDALVRDSFSFFLTASNVQPVPVGFEIEVNRTVAQKEDELQNHKEEEEDASDDSSKQSSSKMLGITSQEHMKITIIVCGAIFVLIVVLVAFKCYRRHRNKRRQLAGMKEDSKSPLADPSSPVSIGSDTSATEVGVDNRFQSPSSMNNAGHAVPVINVTPETPTLERRNISNRQLTQAIVEPNPLNNRTVAPLDSKTVPDSGLSLDQFDVDVQSRMDNSINQQSSPDGVGGKKDCAVFDWENIDPELLEHCRKTTPVLHKNQYWV